MCAFAMLLCDNNADDNPDVRWGCSTPLASGGGSSSLGSRAQEVSDTDRDTYGAFVWPMTLCPAMDPLQHTVCSRPRCALDHQLPIRTSRLLLHAVRCAAGTAARQVWGPRKTAAQPFCVQPRCRHGGVASAHADRPAPAMCVLVHRARMRMSKLGADSEDVPFYCTSCTLAGYCANEQRGSTSGKGPPMWQGRTCLHTQICALPGCPQPRSTMHLSHTCLRHLSSRLAQARASRQRRRRQRRGG